MVELVEKEKLTKMRLMTKVAHHLHGQVEVELKLEGP